MERIFETLPAAKKWALILCIVLGIVFVINFFTFILSANFRGIIELVLQGFLIYFLFAYYRACGAGIEDESEESLEEACRQQKNIFLIYGIQAALLLIAFLLIAVAVIVALISSGGAPSGAL